MAQPFSVPNTGDRTITVQRVNEAGEFGKIFFRIVGEKVQTVLRPGMMLGYRKKDEIMYALIISIREVPLGLMIKCYKDVAGVTTIEPLLPAPHIFVRTDCNSNVSVKMGSSGVVYRKRQRILAAAIYNSGEKSLVPKDECHGIIEDIFSYNEINSYFFLMTTSGGPRVLSRSEIFRAVPLNEEEDAIQLINQLNSVRLNMRVRIVKREATGTVVGMIYYPLVPFIADYVIRLDDGNTISCGFNERVLPLEPVAQTSNVLQEYQNLANAIPDCAAFLYKKVMVKTLSRIDNVHVVAIIRRAMHKCIQNMPTPRENMVLGYFILPKTCSWKDYDFLVEPGEEKELTCVRTGKITTTDFA